MACNYPLIDKYKFQEPRNSYLPLEYEVLKKFELGIMKEELGSMKKLWIMKEKLLKIQH